MFKVLALYWNTGMETLSPSSDSSSKKFCFRPIQYQSLLEFINIHKRYLVDTLLHGSQTM